MAGYRLTACLPGEAGEHLDEAVGEALAPFWTDQDRDVSQDLRIWDHWRISGGAEGVGFRIRPGCEDDPRIVRDRPGWAGTVEPALPGWCAGGPRGLLVVHGTSERTAELAGAAWDHWQEVLREHPRTRPWEDFRPNPLGRERSDYEAACIAAHAEYLAQTPVAPFREWAAALPADPAVDGFESVLRAIEDPLGTIGTYSREAYVSYGGSWAAACENLLTLDGWWCERGRAPLHGACGDPAACPHTPPSVRDAQAAAAHLAGLPADTLLVSVRCHV
ncbi:MULTISPECIES: hypothetical protein [unclassified Streptomyces]|uniref:hypothetical protein n=1 Tax=unclassified Streptomyces TaxID=2593676 RepID=UPI002887B8E2|nr:hypothetical protein [Streptomyces sp. DSM 41633]